MSRRELNEAVRIADHIFVYVPGLYQNDPAWIEVSRAALWRTIGEARGDNAEYRAVLREGDLYIG